MKPVTVIHPIPFRVVPRGMRRERTVLGAGTTHVELREEEPGAFEPIPFVPYEAALDEAGASLHAHDGRLWARFRDMGDATQPSRDGGFVAEKRLADWLAGRVPGQGSFARLMGRHFGRTPVAAMEIRDMAEPGGPTASRGSIVPVGARTVGDMTERASAALRGFLANDVRIVAGEAYLRIPGPMAVQPVHGRPEHFLSLLPRWQARTEYSCHPGLMPWLVMQQAFVLQWGSKNGFRNHVVKALGDDGSGIPPELIDHADAVHAFATDLPALLWQEGRVKYKLMSMMAATDYVHRMERLKVLGSVGLLGDGDLVEQVGEIATMVKLLRGNRPSWNDRLAYHADFIAEQVMPRLSESMPSPEDADAMRGLGL